MTKRTVADRLDCSLSTVDRLIRDRRIEYVKIGGSVKFTPSAVDAFLAAATRPVLNDNGREDARPSVRTPGDVGAAHGSG